MDPHSSNLCCSRVNHICYQKLESSHPYDWKETRWGLSAILCFLIWVLVTRMCSVWDPGNSTLRIYTYFYMYIRCHLKSWVFKNVPGHFHFQGRNAVSLSPPPVYCSLPRLLALTTQNRTLLWSVFWFLMVWVLELNFGYLCLSISSFVFLI